MKLALATCDPPPGRLGYIFADEELRAGRKARRHGAWIAATALRHSAAVVTQDTDFTVFAAVKVIRV